jgi:hypothetical protein
VKVYFSLGSSNMHNADLFWNWELTHL